MHIFDELGTWTQTAIKQCLVTEEGIQKIRSGRRMREQLFELSS